ncbi:hypothetical protein [Leptolyngbya sp. FACHB-17]|uniref:hypothetical protein n=1 Tax=unclassified Leptolyngbya TaxID=2650499 RepID=UPI0016804053|nr:hypothetical protein [Leptolyngbya sp. FACHB-17]MBD2079551.1 hypothetical protein [Leptolyngbya sp. FACHB-17]
MGERVRKVILFILPFLLCSIVFYFCSANGSFGDNCNFITVQGVNLRLVKHHHTVGFIDYHWSCDSRLLRLSPIMQFPMLLVEGKGSGDCESSSEQSFQQEGQQILIAGDFYSSDGGNSFTKTRDFARKLLKVETGFCMNFFLQKSALRAELPKGCARKDYFPEAVFTSFDGGKTWKSERPPFPPR